MNQDAPAESQGKIIVFGAKQIRRAWVDEEWFFSVVDIVGALTDSPNPRNYLSMMKVRETEASGVQLSTICVQLKLASADGKPSKLRRGHSPARTLRDPDVRSACTRGRWRSSESPTRGMCKGLLDAR